MAVRAARHAHSKRRRRRRRLRLVRTIAAAGCLVALIAWLALSNGTPASGGGPPAPAPAANVRVTLGPRTVVGPPATGGSATAPLPWPSSGQSAVAIPAIGYVAQSGAEQAVPVASLTKIMTAYIVLHDHPLAPGAQGPRVTITAADTAQFATDLATDQSEVKLVTGEVLTEYQMLEGLLVHSANDLAYALASWDAGSVSAFVAKMNATAHALGMAHTHFVDPSGFDPGSQSTAAGLLKVASLAMANPTFAQIVSMPEVTLPVAGTVLSYTPMLGTPGVLGVKSGFTTAAGGGDVLAYRAAIGGRTFVVLAAVTSQEGPTVLARAGSAALALAKAAAAMVHPVTVARAGTVVAQLEDGGKTVAARTGAAATVLDVAGGTVRQRVHVDAPPPGARKGTAVGTAAFVVGSQNVSVPVRLADRMP